MTLGRHAVATDPGRKRRHNEDAYVVEPPLFAVADGMGGAQAGEVASKLAAGALREGGSRALEDLIQEANRRVHQRSIEDPGAAGMGTTMTVAMVEDGSVRFGHVGDSRAYLVRAGRLEQLTQDHSLVGELVRSGQLAREDAESHPQRSVITRAVGTDPDVDVDTFAVDAQEGDVFLLCSDGLTDMVADDRIEQLVEEQRDDLDRLVKALVRAANKGGGDDNITVIAFEIGSAGARAADDEATMVVRRPEQGDPDDEDTLTEEDGVPTIPTVDTMVVSADELAAAYDAERAAAPPKRRRRSDALLLLLVLLVFAALVLLALWGLYR